MVMKDTNTHIQYKFTKSLSDEARFFLEPEQPKQRQYEALRVEKEIIWNYFFVIS